MKKHVTHSDLKSFERDFQYKLDNLENKINFKLAKLDLKIDKLDQKDTCQLLINICLLFVPQLVLLYIEVDWRSKVLFFICSLITILLTI